MQMLTVTTLMEVSTVNAGWDILEMDSNAQVLRICLNY